MSVKRYKIIVSVLTALWIGTIIGCFVIYQHDDKEMVSLNIPIEGAKFYNSESANTTEKDVAEILNIINGKKKKIVTLDEDEMPINGFGVSIETNIGLITIVPFENVIGFMMFRHDINDVKGTIITEEEIEQMAEEVKYINNPPVRFWIEADEADIEKIREIARKMGM